MGASTVSALDSIADGRPSLGSAVRAPPGLGSWLRGSHHRTLAFATPLDGRNLLRQDPQRGDPVDVTRLAMEFAKSVVKVRHGALRRLELY